VRPRELLLVIKDVYNEVRIRDNRLKRSDNIVDLRLGGSLGHGNDEVHRGTNLLEVRVNVIPVDSPSVACTGHFRARVHVVLGLDNQLIGSINSASSRLAFRSALLIEGLLEHDGVECQIGIHGMLWDLVLTNFALLTPRLRILRFLVVCTTRKAVFSSWRSFMKACAFIVFLHSVVRDALRGQSSLDAVRSKQPKWLPDSFRSAVSKSADMSAKKL